MNRIIDKINKIFCVLFSIFGVGMFITLLICAKKTDVSAGENIYDNFKWLITISQVSFIVGGITLFIICVASFILYMKEIEDTLWDNLFNVSRTFASGAVLIASISLPFNGGNAALVYAVILVLGLFSLIADFRQVKVAHGKKDFDENINS